jgi:RNA polymerase sigma-70 factor (ECF subfamily)
VTPVTDPEREKRFRSLADLVVEPVRRYLARRTDPATAAEVFNETLLVCWRRLDEVPGSPDGSVSHDAVPWAIVVARNLLANAQRAERRRNRLVGKIIALDPPVAAIGDTPPDEAGDADALFDALTRLRSADAELLRLWAWDGLESPQLATVLGISANAAAIRLHRAKARLRAELLDSPRFMKSARPAGHVEAEEGSTNARR